MAVLKSRKNINNKKPWARRFSIKNKKIIFLNPNYFFKKLKLIKIFKNSFNVFDPKKKLKMLNYSHSLIFKNKYKKKNKVKSFLMEFVNF